MNDNILKRLHYNIPLLAVVALAGLIIFSRCANQGMPTGGPKDSIPPSLIESSPKMKEVNFSGEEVRLTFNEYIVADAISEELVISPPLSKRPTVRTKSRTLIIGFNEEMKPDVTYSLDFKNSVVDNNESNPYPGLRLLFGTGATIDTLRVAGMVKDALYLEPKEKITVMLYSNLEDTAVFRSKPDYIARTDKRGLYLFDNVKPGKYHLFALNDANTNLLYDMGAEEFSFADSVIVPTASYVELPDTLAIGADSMLISGQTIFKPDPIYLRTFTEDFYEQFLDKSTRGTRYSCTFVFGESVKDTFGIRLLNREADNWYLLEPNIENDSIIMWVTDTLVAKYDTLKLEIAYYQLDSLKQKYLERDTLQLISAEKERAETRRRKKDEDIVEVVQFSFADNLKNIGFDLNQPILLQSPKPVKNFDFSKIKLTRDDDPALTPLKFEIQKDTTTYRTFRLDYKWEPSTQYTLEIDSAACENIYGETSMKVEKKFMTQESDYYGRIILNLTSVEKPLIVCLLENSKDEKLLDTITTAQNGKVTFDFLRPGKFKVKIIFDENDNGAWDTGSYTLRRQPERVAYLPEIVKVRSNWDNQYDWDLKPDPTFRKILIDKEEEELKLKKLKEERLKEMEQERDNPIQEQGGGFTIPR